MNTTAAEPARDGPGPLDRLLRLFADVRPGERARAMLMLVNVFPHVMLYLAGGLLLLTLVLYATVNRGATARVATPTPAVSGASPTPWPTTSP